MTAPARACTSCQTPLPESAHFYNHCGAPTPVDPGVPPRTGTTEVGEVARVRKALAAIAEGKKSLALMPISKDASNGAYDQHQLVRIYIMVGEPEKALDQLEPLLKVPYLLSPAWLRIDPAFAPLKGNPRFERLLTGG